MSEASNLPIAPQSSAAERGGAGSEPALPTPAVPQSPAVPSVPTRPKAAVNFQPVAWHLTTKLRSTARQLVQDFKPGAAHKQDVLAAAKSAALTLIDSFPEDVNGIEVKLEVGGASAHHLLLIVYPHKL